MNKNKEIKTDCYVEDLKKALFYSGTIILIMWIISLIIN